MSVSYTHLDVYKRQGSDNCVDASVFPEFITIAKFDIGKTILVVIFQGALKNRAVRKKIIGSVSLAPMTVAHNYDAGVFIIGKNGSGGVDFIQFIGKRRHQRHIPFSVFFSSHSHAVLFVHGQQGFCGFWQLQGVQTVSYTHLDVDPDSVWDQMKAEFEEAGIEKILTEKQKQLDNWLADNK